MTESQKTLIEIGKILEDLKGLIEKVVELSKIEGKLEGLNRGQEIVDEATREFPANPNNAG